MLASSRLPLGAPGIYPLPDYVAPRLNPQRMDVCAFVGVAPRGPAYVPVVDEHFPDGYRMMADLDRPRRRSVAVPVKSFDDYRRLFGAFEGPGQLPYAVASFFEQGGRMAYIVRIVHERPGEEAPDTPPHVDGLAVGELAGIFAGLEPLRFLARNEGSWGDKLRVEAAFSIEAIGFEHGAAGAIWVDRATAISPGSLLRFTDAFGVQQFAFCRDIVEIRDELLPISHWQLVFDAPPLANALRIERVEAELSVSDGTGNVEQFSRLALTPGHARFIATVLCNDSTLIWPHYDWAGTELQPAGPAVELLRGATSEFGGGTDFYEDLIPGDFFDELWSVADELPGEGVTAVYGLGDVTHLIVPDLYLPEQWVNDGGDVETRIDEAGPCFAPCVRSQTTISSSPVPPSALTGLILDPRRSDDLQTIAGLQNKLIAFCEATQDLIALLDLPPGLSQGQAERWRAQFNSSWGAAYYPWLIASRRAFSLDDDRLDTLRPVTPSAIAAGIIARKEMQRGIQFGPANEIAEEIVDLAEKVPERRVDALHPQGLNAFRRESDGIHLIAARTLSRDPQWRQLSVRRLVLMLRRTLLRETQWAVFEPNGPKLWRDLRHAIENLLRRLYQAGAFAGSTEAQSFFVRIRNESHRLQRGELLVEIGIAPAEPIEFIVLQLRRNGDGTLTLEE